MNKACEKLSMKELATLARKLDIDVKKQSDRTPNKMVLKKKSELCSQIVTASSKSDAHKFYVFAYLCHVLKVSQVKELAKASGVPVTKKASDGRRITKTKAEICKEFKNKIKKNYKLSLIHI